MSGFREAGDIHQPRLPLDHEIVAGQTPARPRRAVTRDRAINETLVERARAVGAQSQPLERARPEVLDENVRAADERFDQLTALGRLEIDGDALRVAVRPEVVRAPAVDEGRPPARLVSVVRVLDLDHLGPHVAEQHRAEGAGEDTREVEDGETGEGQRGQGAYAIRAATTFQAFSAHGSSARPRLGSPLRSRSGRWP